MQFPTRVAIPFILLMCLLLNACASGGHAPVVSPSEDTQARKSIQKKTITPKTRLISARPAGYTVKKGDTLYSIAWNYGLDYRHVAAWNAIRSPFTIYPGQRLRLHPATTQQITQKQSSIRKQPAPLTPGPVVRSESNSKTTKNVTVSPAQKKESIVEPQPVYKTLPNMPGPGDWLWPTLGKVIKMDSPISKNGIDITGNEGQNIQAAASGEVVYSGSGLLGYGRLIIIKHNDTFLSAYAHNKDLLVKEGERVKAGQKIALMGRTSDGRTLLHFEIRKNGQPVNPLKFLPNR